MKPFAVHLHYCERHRLPKEVEDELGLTFHESTESLAKACDVLSIHCPLMPETEHLFNDWVIGAMKRGSYIVNTARGKICESETIARALASGQLTGYAGDVWFPQPAPENHPWRTMANNAMTPIPLEPACQARHVMGPEPGKYWNAGLLTNPSEAST